MTLGIYIPTLGRHQKLQAVADNIQAATKNDYRLYWCVESHDTKSRAAAEKTGAKVFINTGKACYADALQTIYEQTNEPIFLWGNDDFYFLEGWDVRPLDMMAKDEGIGVLGLHDGNPATGYSAISLVRRSYVEQQSGVVDMPNRVLYPYDHNYVDNELTETAQARGAWDRCTEEAIQHQHPSFKWLGDFPVDDTYRKNDKNLAKDNELFHNRRQLWR